jgi:tetratricopeptide (TPR) repeat protein
MATTPVAGSVPIRQTIFDPSFLLPKIGKLFWVCVTGGILFSLSRFVKSYQYTFNPQSLWNDDYKLIQCQALLAEVRTGLKESITDRKLMPATHPQFQPLLDECHARLTSIKDSHEKHKVLLALALMFAKIKPSRALQLAQAFSTHELLKVASAIHPEVAKFDSEFKWDQFEERFVEFTRQENAGTPANIDLVLEFATIFHNLKKGERVAEALDYAYTLMLKMKTTSDSVQAYCKMAISAQAVEERVTANDWIGKACDLWNDQEKQVNFPEIQMLLAETLFSMKKYPEMDNALKAILDHKQHVAILPPVAERFVQLIKKILGHPGANSDAVIWLTKTKLLPTIFLSEGLTPENSAKVLSSIAQIYRLVKNENARNAFKEALGEVNKLPGDSPDKFERLMEITCLDNRFQTVPLLEKCYLEGADKVKMGWSILCLYTSLEMKQETVDFLNTYVKDITNDTTKDVVKKINDLTRFVGDEGLMPELKESLIISAKRLLTDVPSNQHMQATAYIAKAYLQMGNWQKSLELLTSPDYCRRQGRWHFFVASLAATATLSLAFGRRFSWVR